MAKRRGHKESSIYQRKDGRWYGAVHLGYEGGKRKRRYVSGATRREVAEKIKALQVRQAQGINIAPDKRTLHLFMEQWLEDVVKVHKRQSTYFNYQLNAKRHIFPHIGRVILTKLEPSHVQSLYARLKDEGMTNGISVIHTILSSALSHAMKIGYTHRNVASLVDVPRFDTKQQQVFSAEQALIFLASIHGHKHELAFRLGLSLGLRSGEVLALQKRDINLEAGTITIRHTLTFNRITKAWELGKPKTKSSAATLPLPNSLYQLLTVYLQNKKPNDMLFTSQNGTGYMAQQTLVASFKYVLRRAGLPDMRFHDLRHSCASFLVAENEHPRVIMEVLRHARIGTTMELYSHVAPESQRLATSKLDARLTAALPAPAVQTIQYTRYDGSGVFVDSDTAASEAELAIIRKATPKGWQMQVVRSDVNGQTIEEITC